MFVTFQRVSKGRCEMRTRGVRTKPRWTKGGFQVWIFFGAIFVALVCSAIVGTESVRAAGTCTAQQCTDARTYAGIFCGLRHSGVLGFTCPIPGEDDDFFVFCGDPNHTTYKGDCSNVHNPS